MTIGRLYCHPSAVMPASPTGFGVPDTFSGLETIPRVDTLGLDMSPFQGFITKQPNHQPSNSPYAHFVSGGFTPPRGPQFGRTKVRPYILHRGAIQTARHEVTLLAQGKRPEVERPKARTKQQKKVRHMRDTPFLLFMRFGLLYESGTLLNIYLTLNRC